MVAYGTDNSKNADATAIKNAEKHFEFFKSLYDQALQTWYVRKACASYNYGKRTLHLENVLKTIEERVSSASSAGLDYAIPLYADYVYPATESILNKLIVPGVENSKMAFNKSKDAATIGGTTSLSLAVVATQVGLIGSAAVTALLLDGIIMVKKNGLAVVEGVVNIENAIKQRIWNIITRSRTMVMVPVEIADDYANSFIDIISAVLENNLDMPLEEDPEYYESSNIGYRVSCLARRVVTLLKTRTNENLIEPTKKQLNALADNLQKALQLIDILKQQPYILLSSVGDLKTKLVTGEITDSAQDLWNRVQAEAKKYKVSPEVVLIRSIKRCSFILKDYIAKLRHQTNEILPAATAQHLDAAAIYVEELNTHLETVNGINDVKDEVLQKAKQTLDEVANWTSNLIVRKASDTNISSV